MKTTMKTILLVVVMLLMPLGLAQGQENPPPSPAPPSPPTQTNPSDNGPVRLQGGTAPASSSNPAGTFPATNPLAAGALEEAGNLNLAAAMKAYQSIISRFDAQRAEAANAIFRLGECCRKLGRMQEAKVEYARILREFPDQVDLAKLSAKYLFKPAAETAEGQSRFQQRSAKIVRGAPAPPPANYEAEKANPFAPGQSMEEYLQQKLADARVALAGLSTQYGSHQPLVVAQQAKIAALEKQLAELHQSQPKENALSAAHIAEQAGVRRQHRLIAHRLLEEQISLIRQQIALTEKKLAGLKAMRKQDPTSVSDQFIDDVKKALLSLKRDLSEWEAKEAAPSRGAGSARRNAERNGPQSTATEEEGMPVVWITREAPHFHWAYHPVIMAELRAKLAEAVKRNPMATRVLVRCDQRIPFKELLQITDIAQNLELGVQVDYSSKAPKRLHRTGTPNQDTEGQTTKGHGAGIAPTALALIRTAPFGEILAFAAGRATGADLRYIITVV